MVGGDDTVNGGPDDDLVLFGDLLFEGAGDGNDVALGGDDVVIGGEGDDIMTGDRLALGVGIDSADLGDDLMIGGSGDDSILSDFSALAETVVEGDDSINCGPGEDFADGGPGWDRAWNCEVTVDVEES